MIERSCFPADFVASEIDRYLGLPGQAISYKVGERVWLECRQAAKARKGAAFDLKDFHRYALDLGDMGLDQLARELDKTGTFLGVCITASWSRGDRGVVPKAASWLIDAVVDRLAADVARRELILPGVEGLIRSFATSTRRSENPHRG